MMRFFRWWRDVFRAGRDIEFKELCKVAAVAYLLMGVLLAAIYFFCGK